MRKNQTIPTKKKKKNELATFCWHSKQVTLFFFKTKTKTRKT